MASLISNSVSTLTVPPLQLLPYIIGSAIFCFATTYFSRYISTILFKSYSSLSKIDQIEWNTRVVSTIHALVIGYVGSSLFYSRKQLYGDLDLFYGDFECAVFYAISFGYFIYDTYYTLKYYPKFGGISMVVHHIAASLCQVLGFVYWQTFILGTFLSVTEFTTPLVNFRWFFEKAAMKESKLYVINGLALWVLWFFLRVIPSFYEAYIGIYNADKLMSMPGAVAAFICFQLMIVVTLNTFWYYKITMGAMKALFGKKKGK